MRAVSATTLGLQPRPEASCAPGVAVIEPLAMSAERRVLVISDLHVGAGLLDDFDSEVEQHFVAFLEHWLHDAGDVELVINGDMMDFVQAPPFTGADLEDTAVDGTPLCFTEDQSVRKFAAIAQHHPAAFDALARFLGGAGKSLTILPGNHDADLYWPQVQSALRARLSERDSGATARVRIHLDPVYRPAGHEHLWIEHGHQSDEVNAFMIGGRPYWSAQRPPILRGRTGAQRLYECIGTRLLIRYLNRLDADYPLVDNVKPFGRFLKIFGASALTPGYGPLKVSVLIGAMMRYLSGTIATRPSDLMELDTDASRDDVEALRRAAMAALPSELAAFGRALLVAGFAEHGAVVTLLENDETARRLADFVAEHIEVLEAFGSHEPEASMALGRAFTADESGDLQAVASRILRDASHNCRFVTMGHTHQVVDDGSYFNTGCWTRYYEYRPEETLRPWAMLKAGSYATFPYSLRFLRSETTSRATVCLDTFAERHHG